jgi:hypothetical protein
LHSPKAPAPDPAVAAAQASEQRRAEAGQVAQTQTGLNADTIALRRRFGVMAGTVGGNVGGFGGAAGAAGGAPAAAAPSAFAAAMGVGSGGIWGGNPLVQLS